MRIIGWDIGGAHLKAALLQDGQIIDGVQSPTPLWQGTDQLAGAVGAAYAKLGPADLHAATMTGELADIFASRAEGVAAITATLTRHLAPLRLYGGRVGFLEPAQAAVHVSDIASANWHASAAVAAAALPAGLFVDMGSTTTDIVPLAGGQARSVGYTDAERLAAGELVFTGVVRSFLMALAPRAPLAGGWTTLACEHFATMADVYRLLDDLPDDADQMPTADGRDKTKAASRARLARMVGRDATDATDAAWRALAAWFAETQLRLVGDGAAQVLSRLTIPAEAPVIGAGIGRFVAARLAARLGRPFVDFTSLVPAASSGPGTPGPWVSQCAPSVAVALLAAARFRRPA